LAKRRGHDREQQLEVIGDANIAGCQTPNISRSLL
jgi:hypothetical protein